MAQCPVNILPNGVSSFAGIQTLIVPKKLTKDTVSEMQSKLLQKIEELTLYVIELNRENESLNKRLKKLENKKGLKK